MSQSTQSASVTNVWYHGNRYGWLYGKMKSFRGQYTLLSHRIMWGSICLKCAEKDTHFSHHRRLKPWHSSLKRMKTSHLVGQNQCKAITLAAPGVGSMCTCAACRQWRLQWRPSRASAEICNCRSLCRSLLAYKITQMWNVKKTRLKLYVPVYRRHRQQ